MTRSKLLIALSLTAFFALAVVASASHAPTNLRIVRHSAKTVTIGWNAVAGVTGYGLYVDGTRVATAGATATQARFGTPQYRRYTLGVLALKTGGDMSTITVEPRWETVSVYVPPEPIPLPVCSDGIDNDSDGKIDYPADPGCISAADTDETDPPIPPPPASGANLWVDANGGSCVRSTVVVGYADGAACASFAAAYTAAQSGDVVGVIGSVGVQKFAGGYQSTQGSGTKTLLFRGAAGNKVRQINFGSPNLSFDGINIDAGAQPITGAALENGGDAFVFRNGSIGNVRDEKGALVTGSGIVFDNVYFHDVVIATSGVHSECIFAAVPEGMIVRRSTFTNCAVMDIFFVWPDWWSPTPPAYGNVILEDNVFGDPVGSCCGIYVGGTGPSGDRTMRNWTVRRNEFGDSPNPGPQSGGVYCGNTGAAPASWKTVC